MQFLALSLKMGRAMIIDTTQTKIEAQITDKMKAPLPFFYGTTFYPLGAELPDDVIREVLLNGFHDGFRGFSSVTWIENEDAKQRAVTSI